MTRIENNLVRMSSRREWIRARFAVAMVLASFAAATVRADDADDRYVVVKTKKAITVSGEEIADAMIVITGGKIEAVGKKVDYPSDSRVIDASDLVAMPGMIDPHTSIGLPAVTRSGNQSHRKLSDSYYPPDGDLYQQMLEAGYTMVALYPPGSGMPGQYLVQSTYQPKDHAGLKDAGLIRVLFQRPASDKRALRDVLKAAQAEIDKEKEAATKPAEGEATSGNGAATSNPASQPAASAPASQPASQPSGKAASKPAGKPAAPTVPPQIETFVNLLKKKDGFSALVELGRASDLLHYEQAIGEHEFSTVFFFAGLDQGDLYNVIDHKVLGEAKASVALRPLLVNMPMSVNPYNPARLFTEAGCTVAFFPVQESVDEHETMRERLSLLVRNGLDRKDALKAVTLNAAKLLGMDKEYGAIAKDKFADLIFLDGDPLDPASKVKRVMIHGEMVWDAARSKTLKR